MNKIKIVHVLGYYKHGRHIYIRSTTKRAFDSRHCINQTDDISKAKTFTDKTAALNFLSMCITNTHKYEVQEYRKPIEQIRQPNFSQAAMNAML